VSEDRRSCNRPSSSSSSTSKPRGCWAVTRSSLDHDSLSNYGESR
jgi:hypothetical protein